MNTKMYNRPINITPTRKDGYQIFIDSRHPLADSSGIVYYHRHVASLARGRWLLPVEQVHHRDGNRENNDPSNLEVLTRTQHALVHHAERGNTLLRQRPCAVCGKPFLNRKKKAKYCSHECARIASQRIQWDQYTIAKDVWSRPLTALAQHYGVTDVAIKKYCKKNAIPCPPQGYWAKMYANKLPGVFHEEHNVRP